MTETIEYDVPIKRYGMLIFFFGTSTLMIGGLICASLFEFIGNPISKLHIDIRGLIIFFPFFFMYSMWLIFGYEKVTIENQNIILLKSNRILTIRRTFAISGIQSIKVKEKRFQTERWIDVQKERMREKQRAVPFWLRMGQLILVTKEKEFTFFNGLSGSDIHDMKEKMEKIVEIKKQSG